MPPPPRPRDEDRITGTQFLESLRGLTREQVEERIFQEVTRGNIPDFLRPENFFELAVNGTVDGQEVEIRIQVAIDYLAVGTNEDYVRVPVSPLLAQRIADRFGYVLPTERVVRILDEESQLERQDMPFLAAPDVAMLVIDPQTGRQVYEKWNHQQYGAYEGRWMTSLEFTEKVNTLANEQILQRRLRGGIRAGHKKDIIYHPETTRRQSVCIFHPRVQGVNFTSHDDLYRDYSHGARYILNQEQDPHNPRRTRPAARVIYHNPDGSSREVRMTIDQIIRDRSLYQLLSPQRMDIRTLYRRSPDRRTGLRELTPRPGRQAEEPEHRRLLRV